VQSPAKEIDERTAHLLADFFDNAAVGLHWVGADGTVLRANRAELDLLGYREDEYVGHHISEFHADAPVISDILQRLTCGETLDSYEARLRCKNGDIRHVLISSNVLWDNGRFVHTRCLTRDITEQKLARQALAESNRRKDAILNASLDAIITMDHRGCLLDFNAAAQRIFGYTSDYALGKPLADLIIPSHLRERHTAGLRRHLETGETAILGRRLELSALHADGHEFPVELSVARVQGDGPPIFAGTIRDITDRKRAEEDLNRTNQMLRESLEARRVLLESERAARSAAERLSEMKDAFLATLSHELRTPLSAILGWVHILRRGSRNAEDVAKGLDIIERNSRIQTRMIDELLDTSRITSGKVRLDIQQVDVAGVVRAALEAVRPAADAKAIRIQEDLEPDAGTVAGDYGRLQQVFWNLLSNAIKFTPEGGSVRIRSSKDGSAVKIAVHDSGCGISTEFLPHVFERFRQADSSTTRRHGGLGLGLAIVKTLVEQHGGSIEAASAGEGRGATFSVRLPTRALSAAAASDAYSDAQSRVDESPFKPFRGADLAGLRILVVDDEPDALTMLERLLGECGAHAITASSAAQALRLFEHRTFDLVISDIGMPDTDGYELMRRIRAMHSPQRSIKALALTAFVRPEDRERALAAGFDAHLPKPVEPSDLVAKVAALAGRHMPLPVAGSGLAGT
jgi:PAS domain S-box-containing protein